MTVISKYCGVPPTISCEFDRCKFKYVDPQKYNEHKRLLILQGNISHALWCSERFKYRSSCCSSQTKVSEKERQPR